MSTLQVNTISESTSNSGVTVDGVQLKDNGIQNASGTVLQVVTYMNPITAANVITSTSWTDIEQSSGTNLTATITPKQSDSKLLFQGQFISYHEYGQKYAYVQALRDISGGSSDTVVWNAMYRAENSNDNYNDDFPVMYQFIDTPNTTSAVTYHFQGKVEHSSAEFAVLNYASGERSNSIVIWEIGV